MKQSRIKKQTVSIDYWLYIRNALVAKGWKQAAIENYRKYFRITNRLNYD